MGLLECADHFAKLEREDFASPDSFQEIEEELRNNAGFEKLSIERYQFEDMQCDDEYTDFLRCLSQNKTLKEINTDQYLKEDGEFQPIEVAMLLDAIACIPTLETLLVFETMEVMECLAFSRLISNAKSLKRIWINLSITDTDPTTGADISSAVEYLANALNQNSSLQDVSISFEFDHEWDEEAMEEEVEYSVCIDNLIVALAGMTSLRKLNLSGRRTREYTLYAGLDSIHSLFCSARLEELQVDRLSIQEAAGTLAPERLAVQQPSASTLKKVTLSYIEEGLSAFAKALEQRNSSIESLRVSGDDYAGIIAVAKAIHSNASIEDLYLPSYSTGGEEVIQTVLSSKYAISSLKRFNMRLRPAFSQPTIDQLKNVIEKNQVLNELEFECSVFSSDSIRALGHVLSRNPALRSLKLTNIEQGADGAATDEAFSDFFASLATNRNLKKLDLSKSAFSNECINSLTTSVRAGFALEELRYISENGFHRPPLGGLFLESSKLKCIEIGNDFFMDWRDDTEQRWRLDFWPSIVDNLRTKQSLEKLSISGSNLSDEGCMAIAAALQTNTTLKVLELQNCQISNRGASAMATMLAQNNSLEQLELSRNDIQCGEVMSLFSQSLIQNSSLKLLRLRPRDDSEQRLNHIQSSHLLKMLEANTTILMLDVGPSEDADFDRTKSYYIRLNHMGRKRLLGMLSKGAGRKEWVEALIESKWDLDCSFYLLKLNPAAFCDL